MSTPAQATRCSGKSKQSGAPCRQPPIPGGSVCYYHGGAAPQVIAAAERRLAARKVTADANAVLAHEGIEPVEDPLLELSKLASGSRALMLALGERVNALNDVEIFDAKNTPQLRVVVELYERAMDRTHRMLDSLVKHGYTERQVNLAEREALLVAGIMRRVIQGLGLTPEQTHKAGTMLAAEFRQLQEGTDLL